MVTHHAFDDDEGGDVIPESFQLQSNLQTDISAAKPAAPALAKPPAAALTSGRRVYTKHFLLSNLAPAKPAAAVTSGRQVYNKQYLLSNLAMGAQFEGPLTVVPRTLTEKKKAKLRENVLKDFFVVVDRIRSLVRQNSREYFTKDQLAQVYTNVYGERIPDFEELYSHKEKNSHKNSSIIYMFVPDIKIEIYPKAGITKIFWNDESSGTGHDSM